MSNMSYCRFENTLQDLRDCYDALCEGINKSELSEYEQRALPELLELCKSIASEFEDFELEDEKEE